MNGKPSINIDFANETEYQDLLDICDSSDSCDDHGIPDQVIITLPDRGNRMVEFSDFQAVMEVVNAHIDEIRRYCTEQHVDTTAKPTNTSDLLRSAEILRMLSISKSTLYQWVADGLFPAPIKLGLRASAWRKSDIVVWLARKEVSRYVCISSVK